MSIGPAPKFTQSKYFVPEPRWHLLPEATDYMKSQFEKFMNDPNTAEVYKRSFPSMKKPWYTWEGKFVDKG